MGRMGRAFFFSGRLAQLVGMWLLLVDLFTAGPMGPDPKLFGAGRWGPIRNFSGRGWRFFSPDGALPA